jgi:hypothetical protein
MARTQLTPQTLPLVGPGASYFPSLPITSTCADLVFTAGDGSNNNYVAITNTKTVVLAQNTSTGTNTLTIVSVADAQGRTGDITSYAIGALKTSCFGPFVTSPTGWNQSSPAGLWLNPSSSFVQFAVLNLP